MAADEWVEIVKPKGGKAKLNMPRNGVMFAVNRAPRDSIYTRIFIGAEVAAKLRWEAGTKLRLRWSTGGAPRLKADVAPAGHARSYEVKAARNGAYLTFSTSALPEGFLRTAFVPKIVSHEAIADGAKPNLSDLIIRLPPECYAVGKRHAA